MKRDFDIDIRHPFNELCGTCAQRRGSHFDGACVSRTLSGDAIDIQFGKVFKPTGVYTMDKGVCWDLLENGLEGGLNPNTSFKIKRGK